MSEARIALSRFRACAGRRVALLLLTAVLVAVAGGVAAPAAAWAASPGAAVAGGHPAGGEASLKVPDLGQVNFSGINGRTLLMSGLLVCALGLLFGLVIFVQLRNLPVHESYSSNSSSAPSSSSTSMSSCTWTRSRSSSSFSLAS
jgi:hypothetical protein